MANLFEKGAEWQAKQLAKHCSSPVAYSRGATTTTINAMVAHGSRTVESTQGFLIGEETKDFVFVAEELRAASLFPPAEQDRIEWKGVSYKLVRQSNSQAWDYMDGFGLMVKVSTKAR